MKRIIYFTIAILFGASLVGCTSWERQSFQALSAAQAVLNQAQTDYTAGCPAAVATDPCIPRSQTAFTVITKAKAADVLAVNAMVEYEQVKATSGSGTALNAAQIAAANALAQLPSDLTAVKALYQTGGK